MQIGTLDSSLPAGQVSQMMIAFDPYHIPPQDLDQWILLLILETVNASEPNRQSLSRSCLSLSSSHLGPKANSTQDSEILKRLINRWIDAKRVAVQPASVC